jgi:hypothetical protein
VVLGLDEDGDDITSCVIDEVAVELMPRPGAKLRKGQAATKDLVAQANLAGIFEIEKVADFLNRGKPNARSSAGKQRQILDNMIEAKVIFKIGEKVYAEPPTGDEE